MSGTIGILNVGAGDTKLTFDKSNPAECIRAARIVKDMLKRGYALLIEVGKDDDGRPKYQRALDFDENTCEYIIADFDPSQGVPATTEQTNGESVKAEGAEREAGAGAAGKKTRGPYLKTRRKGADSTSAVAVARTAGG